MTIGELLVKLGLDNSTFHTALSESESKIKGSTGNIGKHFDDAGAHVSKFGGIMSGIGMGIGMGVFNLAADGIGEGQGKRLADSLGLPHLTFWLAGSLDHTRFGLWRRDYRARCRLIHSWIG